MTVESTGATSEHPVTDNPTYPQPEGCVTASEARTIPPEYPGRARLVGGVPTPDHHMTYGELRAWVVRRSAAPLAACLEVVDLLVGAGVIPVIAGPDLVEVDDR